MTENHLNDQQNIPSIRSRLGIYGANFFITEMIGVIAPFLGVFLKKNGWQYDQIGMAAGVSGLGMLLLQIPAGVISDRIVRRRLLLGMACVSFGVCYAVFPLFPKNQAIVYGLLFFTGAMTAFYVPLLAALALSLAGPKRFDWMMGVNQGWSHAGNIAAAGAALLSQLFFGITSVFYTMTVVCIFSAVSLCLIRSRDLKPVTLNEREGKQSQDQGWFKSILTLFDDKRVLILVVSVALFQIANAPAMPVAALYLQHLEGSEAHTAWVVLVAQTVMVPVSLIGARCSMRFGRKPVFAVAFLVLPLRLGLFALTTTPLMIIAVQGLDGLCAGIYDVIICLICSDLTRGKTGFNTLVGVMQTTIALGSFAGPLLQGYVTQTLGFPLTFTALAIIAVAGAVVFLMFMPETKQDEEPESPNRLRMPAVA